MGDLSTRQIRRIALGFRRGILGKQSSDGMCFAVCAPLQGYLGFLGFECELETVSFPQTNHCYLRLKSGWIVDPTADQFATAEIELPKVYVGIVPPLYERWILEARDLRAVGA